MRNGPKSNYAKYAQAYADIHARADALVAQFFADKERPAVVYSNACLGGIEEWLVTSIQYANFFSEKRRPKNEELDSIYARRNHLDQLTQANPEEIFVHAFRVNPWGKTSAAESWANLDKYGRWCRTKAVCEAHNAEWMEKHAPRPGHTKCAQCGLQVPDEKVERYSIWIYGGSRESRTFCSATCGTHNQYAQEG